MVWAGIDVIILFECVSGVTPFVVKYKKFTTSINFTKKKSLQNFSSHSIGRESP